MLGRSRLTALGSGQPRSQVLGEAQVDLFCRWEREWPWQRTGVSIRQRAGGPAIARVCYISMVNHRHLHQAVQVAFESLESCQLACHPCQQPQCANYSIQNVRRHGVCDPTDA